MVGFQASCTRLVCVFGLLYFRCNDSFRPPWCGSRCRQQKKSVAAVAGKHFKLKLNLRNLRYDKRAFSLDLSDATDFQTIGHK